MAKSMSDNIEGDPLLSEDELDMPQRRKTFKSSKRLSIPWTLILVSALSSIMGAIVVTLAGHRLYPAIYSRKSVPLLDVPPLGNLQKVMLGDDRFTQRNATRSHEVWTSLFPKGKGYVSMLKVQKAGKLPDFIQEMSTDGSGRFAIAAFHQLHCLYLIFQDYSAAIKNETFHGRDHTMHCIDYIRTSILCAADTNLEPFKSETDGMIGNGVDGFGSNHQCRNFEKVKKWAELFRYNDDRDADHFEG